MRVQAVALGAQYTCAANEIFVVLPLLLSYRRDQPTDALIGVKQETQNNRTGNSQAQARYRNRRDPGFDHSLPAIKAFRCPTFRDCQYLPPLSVGFIIWLNATICVRDLTAYCLSSDSSATSRRLVVLERYSRVRASPWAAARRRSRRFIIKMLGSAPRTPISDPCVERNSIAGTSGSEFRI